MSVRLITIFYSHYCEKARWALERAHVDFVEEPHVPVLSWRATLGSGGKRTAPVLVDGHTVISDSADILRWADEHGSAEPLYADGEVTELCELFDRKLGPASRRMAYFPLLRLPRKRLAALLGHGAPGWEAGAARWFTPVIGGMIRRGLRVDLDAVARSGKVVDEIYATMGERLSDGRPYLVGDKLSAADLTFAALSTPLVGPEAFVRRFLPDGGPGEEMDALIEQYRATPAGKHALRMYELHRTPD